jgi:hypothetical protein
MAFKSRDARGDVATPGWAWAVACLCALLLLPLVMENHRFLHTTTPLHLAGPATHPAQLALAGHGATPARTAARTPLVVTGRARAGRQLDKGIAPGAPGSGLDLQSPAAALNTDNAPSAASDPTLAAGAPPVLTGAPAGVGVAAPALRSNGLVRNDLVRNGPQKPAQRDRPISAPLIRPRPVTPRARFWARHFRRTGPASRVRRRRNPRFYGFFVTLTNG